MDSNLDNMSIADALNIVSEQVIAKLALPSWVYRLPIKRSDTSATSKQFANPEFDTLRFHQYTLYRRFKRIDVAYKKVADVINTLLAQKIEEVSAEGYDVQSEKGDVFTRLVHAHVNGEGSAKLTLDRDELVSLSVRIL